MSELDLSRAPRGVLAAQALVLAVADQGDLAERHYLELKSTLDLSTKRDKEKVAKFILGAANRMPDVAAAAFEGCGVMVIGVAKDAITGIHPVEMMEISKVIQQYVGAAGPRWDIVWVPVEGSDNQVLVVVVDPPAPGQGPFPCRANGESLTDGRIYIRADGETREAKSEEVDLLIQRGLTGAPLEVDFAVEVIGEVASVMFNKAATIDEYLARQRQRLVAALPLKEPAPQQGTTASIKGINGISGYLAAFEGLSSVGGDLLAEPEDRTEDEYLASIDRWEENFRQAWEAALPKIAASQLVPTVIRVTNRTTTFFHDVEMKLHLEGEVFAFDYSEPEWVDDFSDLELPAPPRAWGPWRRTLDILNYAHLANYVPSSASQYNPPSVSYRNGGSVELDLDVRELRPRGTYESEEDEFVLIVADHSLTSIHGTWELTARDHNDIYSGEIDIVVGGKRDLTGIARQILRLDEEESTE
ncbi:hypothetical protein [Leucobacter triazinivorans]|uniref:Uncharacterized protein n=1 Tax=Leucobacter triazinivorans TaxID=1784719 RepID=A0A4V0Z1W6_9MICO|nr:hypothetical protein [Leucobacter triazinivorans]QBE49839.1 hypothetical protein EVS81_14225 [Leucobacter triazinivorans]